MTILFTQAFTHCTMTTVVHCASCYAHSSVQPLHMFGKGPARGNYLSLFTYRGPRHAPRPRLPHHAPNMTLKQICQMLKLMKQVRKREAATARKQTCAAPAPACCGTVSDRKCVPSCIRRKCNVKRAS
ncbi:uncharacterized protein LOC144190159 isoform X3 [Stigmatopora nigra]